VRKVTAFLLLSLIVSTARAQEQERRLVDRLLRPDMTLQNSAQDKKFVAPPKASDKQAEVRSFYLAKVPRTTTKEYVDQREFSAKEFAAHHFRDGELTSTMQTRAQRAKTFAVDEGTGALSVRDMPGGSKKVASAEFIGSRQFLDKGKSQKSLSQHDTPLTIEQVRELLNKNK
jgi:hypothetical protein